MYEQHPQQTGGTPESNTTPVLQPRIYVASLRDYNDGRLHGAWLDATQDAEDLAADIAAMLAHSPAPGAEEWAIYDLDDFAGLRIDEHEELSRVSLVANLLKQHGPAFAAWAEICGDPNLYESFELGYIGHFADLTAYGRELADDLGYTEELARLVPPCMAPYVAFDDEAFARDLWLGGNIVWTSAAGGGIWIFDNQLEAH